MRTTIQYSTVARSIDKLSVAHTTDIHELQLSLTSIESAERSFSFTSIIDVSYKPFSDGSGFLYVHTDEGVFSFHVIESPNTFIQTFKKITKCK